jgi:hypothetical protein
VRRLRRRGIELACLALGAGVLAGTVWSIGAGPLLRDLRTIGWSLTVILLVESLSVVLNTAGWALAFPSGERPVSGLRLLAARLAGDGVNYLTPSATVGGELLRVRLLGPHAPGSLRWATVGVAKIGQSLAQAIFILLGLATVLPRLATTHGWLDREGAIAVSFAAGAAGVALWAVFVWVVDRGFWTAGQGLLRRLRLGGLLRPSWAGPGREVDAALARLGPWRAAGALGCFVLGWTVGVAEIYLILHWVAAPVDWQTALALETGSVLVDGMLFFVPAKVGTQEGGKVVLFAALGLDPARGLTVGIVRRIRELSYAGLGLIALGCLSAGPTAGPAPARVSSGDCSPFRA